MKDIDQSENRLKMWFSPKINDKSTTTIATTHQKKKKKKKQHSQRKIHHGNKHTHHHHGQKPTKKLKKNSHQNPPEIKPKIHSKFTHHCEAHDADLTTPCHAHADLHAVPTPTFNLAPVAWLKEEDKEMWEREWGWRQRSNQRKEKRKRKELSGWERENK